MNDLAHTGKGSSAPLEEHRPTVKKFKKIFVEITNTCNRACSFCQPTRRPPAFLSPADFVRTLQQIRGCSDHLCLHLLGEPLLHPELPLLLAHCQEQGLRVNLATNGTLLDRQRQTLLSSPALRQLNISLHSFGAEEDAPALEAYLAGILDFVGSARNLPTLLLNLRLWNLPATAPIGGIEQNRRILRRLEAYFALPAPLPAHLTPGQGITLAPRVFLSQERRFDWPHAPAPELGDRGSCRGLRDHVGILVDGTVVPCCLDAEGDIPLGNIRQHSLPEILAGPRATRMREGFARRYLVEPLCRRCTYRQRFNG